MLRITTYVVFIIGFGVNPIFAFDNSGQSVELASLQETEIRGQVTDSNGEPIIGASVQVKGTTNGTVTNVNGEFMIKASPNAVLIV